jgi:hypothetical protein
MQFEVAVLAISVPNAIKRCHVRRRMLYLRDIICICMRREFHSLEG